MVTSNIRPLYKIDKLNNNMLLITLNSSIILLYDIWLGKITNFQQTTPVDLDLLHRYIKTIYGTY